MDIYDLARVCAYEVMPRLVLGMPERLQEWRSKTSQPGVMLYAMTCMLSGAEPDSRQVSQFVWHTLQLEDGRECLIIQYPTLEPCSSTPYFSAVVNPADQPEVYVLSASPEPGQTSLLRLTLAGQYNLGPGPVARLEALQTALSEARHLEAVDCTLKSPELATSVDAGLRR
ncbi:MAG: hypothetical protein J0I12_16350 [Candidatus Eremiobacteraeota bacterium]|nr:hypothetical protein [Candidatus Eremiobacteraeota bacterium]